MLNMFLTCIFLSVICSGDETCQIYMNQKLYWYLVEYLLNDTLIMATPCDCADTDR